MVWSVVRTTCRGQCRKWLKDDGHAADIRNVARKIFLERSWTHRDFSTLDGRMLVNVKLARRHGEAQA